MQQPYSCRSFHAHGTCISNVWMVVAYFFFNRSFSDTVNSQFPSNAFTFGTQINFPVSVLFIHLALTRPSFC